MTAPSAADLAATVRAGIRIHPDEPTDVMVDLEARALAALDALVARCEQLEREVASANFDGHWERAERAERERDEEAQSSREWHRIAEMYREERESAEARVAQLEAALRDNNLWIESCLAVGAINVVDGANARLVANRAALAGEAGA